MPNGSKLESHAEAQQKPGKPKALRQPEPCQIGKSEIFVGNLEQEIKEVAIAVLFKDFGVKSVKKYFGRYKSFSFVELTSPELAQLAIQRLNGFILNGRRITVAFRENRRIQKVPQTNTMMPGLELVSYQRLNGDPIPNEDVPLLPSLKQESFYVVPMEMRSSFLLQMLLDCFKNAAWLYLASKLRGKVGLMVMDTIPQAPYFWAIHLTEERHQDMLKLFTALAEAESKLPFLAKEDAKPGMRCLAECRIGAEGNAWNRCWVLARSKDYGIVFFVDFGRSAMVLLDSLRKLDEDKFWTVSPLAQPFALQEGVFPREDMMRRIMEGDVVGPLDTELHILKFAPKTQ